MCSCLLPTAARPIKPMDQLVPFLVPVVTDSAVPQQLSAGRVGTGTKKLTRSDVKVRNYLINDMECMTISVWNPSPEFLLSCSISKRFCLQWKAFDLLNKMGVYFMSDGVTGGLWRHQQWSPSWILPRIRNQVKTAINGFSFCLTCKIT